MQYDHSDEFIVAIFMPLDFRYQIRFHGGIQSLWKWKSVNSFTTNILIEDSNTIDSNKEVYTVMCGDNLVRHDKTLHQFPIQWPEEDQAIILLTSLTY